MPARYYDPTLGRFVSADTIVPEPGNPQDFNRYAYVRNNPVRYTDPTGHCIFGVDTVVCLAVAGAAIGAAVGYGTQVYHNTQDGMTLGKALTTDIQADPIVRGAFLGGAIGAAVPLVAHGRRCRRRRCGGHGWRNWCCDDGWYGGNGGLG